MRGDHFSRRLMTSRPEFMSAMAGALSSWQTKNLELDGTGKYWELLRYSWRMGFLYYPWSPENARDGSSEGILSFNCGNVTGNEAVLSLKAVGNAHREWCGLVQFGWLRVYAFMSCWAKLLLHYDASRPDMKKTVLLCCWAGMCCWQVKVLTVCLLSKQRQREWPEVGQI